MKRLLSVALLLAITTSAFSAVPFPRTDDKETTRLSVIYALPLQSIQRIARQHGMSARALVKLNPGLSSETLHPGDALLVVEPRNAVPDLPDPLAEIGRGIRGRKQIALTFDCGWVEKNNYRNTVKMLRDTNTSATFFFTGIFLRQNPKEAREVVKAGYPVYNHSRTHPHFKKLTDDAIRAELLGVEDTLASMTSATTHPYWRAPFGERDDRILKIAAALGFQSVYWTIDSRDSASSPTLNSKQIFNRICKDTFRKNPNDRDPLDGAIILCHTEAKATPKALEMAIPYLRKRGYRFVDLPTLLSPNR